MKNTIRAEDSKVGDIIHYIYYQPSEINPLSKEFRFPYEVTGIEDSEYCETWIVLLVTNSDGTKEKLVLDTLSLLSIAQDKDESFKDGLLEERNSLQIKTQELYDFLYSPKSDEIDSFQKDVMEIQLNTMQSYLGCLNVRIENLKL